jgi:hypothetical protein
VLTRSQPDGTSTAQRGLTVHDKRVIIIVAIVFASVAMSIGVRLPHRRERFGLIRFLVRREPLGSCSTVGASPKRTLRSGRPGYEPWRPKRRASLPSSPFFSLL